MLLAGIGLSLHLNGGEAPLPKLPPETFRRIVFLGDSITDGNTYPLLVQSALFGACVCEVTTINAGIGGDTAEGMHKRLARDVLDKKPTLVTFNAGANDSLHGVSVEVYESHVRGIAKELKDAGITLVLLTPNVMSGAPDKKAGATLAAYETVLRKVARDFNLRIGEVRVRQEEDRARGAIILAPDDLHPNYEGQRMIARAALDAFGYSTARVPQRPAHLKPSPGVLSSWKMKAYGAKEALPKDAEIAALKPDGAWKDYALPDPKPFAEGDENNLWQDDFRRQGGAVALNERVGGGNRFIGFAALECARPRKVIFNTGADLQRVYLNGILIYEQKEFRGWHIGRQSVEAELIAGKNTIAIQCGSTFFLSVTDARMWIR